MCSTSSPTRACSCRRSSELASSEERRLADRLLEEDARLGPHLSDLRAALTRRDVDGADFIEDDGPADQGRDEEIEHG